MARIRSIRPEFWKSEAIARHDFFTRLVFIGLWSYVDDNGVGLDNYRLIAAELFPLEEDFAEVSRDVRESLARLREGGRILRYTVAGKAYLSVVNWREHQKIDRPGKSRYPEADHPDATPTPPSSRENVKRADAIREGLDAPSRDSRETPSTGEGEKGRRGEGESTPPSASQPSAAATEPIVGEIVDNPMLPMPALRAVPDPSTEIEPVAETNAGSITAEWIDHCATRGVKLTQSIIGRYGKRIKEALSEGFEPDLIRKALAQMLADNEAARPSYLDNYLIRAQTGAPIAPRRQTPGEASVRRHSIDGATSVGAAIHDALTRPA